MTYGKLVEITVVSDLLHNAQKMGAIEGLYVIALNSQSHEAVLQNLDLVTRTECSFLK